MLLERGAARVVALDVGHGQLSPVVAARTRASPSSKGSTPATMTAALAGGRRRHSRNARRSSSPTSRSSRCAPCCPPLVGDGRQRTPTTSLLVKPQFEVGRTGIREGIVRDPALREEAVNDVLWAAWDLGLPTAGLIASPLVGSRGNHEYLVWLSATSGTNPTQWRDRVHSHAGSDRD